MVLSNRVLRGVAAGEITLAFLRWPTPLVTAGAQLRTAVGLVRVTEVVQVEPEQITDEQAHRAGFSSAAGLRSSVDKHGRGRLHRLALRYDGPAEECPRPLVRLTPGERAAVDRRLARLDVSSPRGSWTRRVLDLLRARPGVRVQELAAEQNRPVSRCKVELWQLRELGLVEPARGGYRLTPRGVSYLDG
ncbi:hypothetical protein GCM10011581_29700 [Saccharopolyspora subtropica]|uniref:Uncharacterized protein n=1 Tax=Saccharopolyspora thermophila TaxID=89367 RepID=A0A917NEQ7_9PSEU|nr:hypothetical protein [Saccharopolyspora subtropica]GGI90702.1 hypothetical protein GCM10011581_29700 [Saccharopolyspora subtropica]